MGTVDLVAVVLMTIAVLVITTTNAEAQRSPRMSYSGWIAIDDWQPRVPIKYGNYQHQNRYTGFSDRRDTGLARQLSLDPSTSRPTVAPTTNYVYSEPTTITTTHPLPYHTYTTKTSNLPVCVDYSIECEAYAVGGGCQLFQDYMSKHCPLTCGICTASNTTVTEPQTINTDLDCVDKYPSCGPWGQQNECKRNPTFMLVACPKTCSSCLPKEPSDCMDRDENCFLASILGQCENNPSFYLTTCPQSCKNFVPQCQTNSSTVQDVCDNRNIECGINPLSDTLSNLTSIPVIMKRIDQNIYKKFPFQRHPKHIWYSNVPKSPVYGSSVPLRPGHRALKHSVAYPARRRTRSIMSSIGSAGSLFKNILQKSVQINRRIPLEKNFGKQLQYIPIPSNSSGYYDYFCYCDFTPSVILNNILSPVMGKNLDIRSDMSAITVDICVLGLSFAALATSVMAMNDVPNNEQMSTPTQPPSTQPTQPQPQPQPQPPPQPPLPILPLLPAAILPLLPPIPPPTQPPSTPPSITIQEARVRARTLVPFCNPEGYLSIVEQLIAIQQQGNTGRPLPESINQLVQGVSFCQYGVGSSSMVEALGIVQEDQSIKKPPPKWPGISYPALTFIPEQSLAVGDIRNTIRDPVFDSPNLTEHDPLHNLITNRFPLVNELNSEDTQNTLTIPQLIQNLIINKRKSQSDDELPTDNELDTLLAAAIGVGDPLDIESSSTGPRKVTNTDTPSSAWECGGSLISPHHIMTAAHCVLPGNRPTVVRLGEIDFNSVNESNAFEYDVQDIAIHPQYKLPQKYNDIAIITLKQKVEFNNLVRSYCYPTTSLDLDGKICTVSGWGVRPNQLASSIIHNLPVEVVNLQECENDYMDLAQFTRIFEFQYPNGFTNSLLCAGKLNSVCRGDSGGPLIFDGGDSLQQVGIVSTGYGCGAAYPGVYTRVDAFTDWIESIIFSKCDN